MSDFKTRLETEKTELDEKLTKLNEFLESEKSKEIDDVQLTLLNVQSKAMEAYSQCLLERIARL